MKLNSYPTGKFYPTIYRNPCPICNDTSGDCRTTDSDLLLCHGYISIDSGLAGWKYRGETSDGVWGKHYKDNGKEFDREQYERNKELREAQKCDAAAFLREHALDADGRDKAIKKIARIVGLSNRDRQSLKARGLTDEMIENGLFFTIEPYKTYYFDLPDNLPGIKKVNGGWQFATKDTGYACITFDKEGRASGWQLRIQGVSEGNKYKWAWSKNFSSKLPNTELPITIIKPDKPVETTDKTLYLSEGILKALVASDRHKISVSGAAGGNFKGSFQQLDEIIKGHDKLVIVPDAGDVINTQVMLRWQRLAKYLKQFELPIYFLWWGQVSKREHQDIDEIDSETFSKVEYLNPEQFFALAKKKQWVKKQWDGWKTYKKFTPQIKIEKKFVEFGLPQKNTITFINSGLGTGKTTQVIKLLKQLENQGIISIGYRNTLLLQFNEKAKDLGFYHLQNDKDLASFNLDDPTINVSNCVDSLPYYKPEQFDGKIIVIDEIISVLKHLLFSQTIGNFERVKELFTEMVNRCDRLICLDGFVQDWAVRFFKELCPTKQVVTIENTYQGSKSQIYLLQGTIDLDEKLRANDKTPWLEKLLNNSVCPAICSDSQVFCEAIEGLLIEQGRRGIRVDSKTVSDKQVKDFFKNPDRWIKENKPEYVIYSPSAESGLDIPTKSYFTEHFAFFFGRLDIDSCIQMLGRIRDINVPKYVWCKKFILSEEVKRRPSNVESIQADRARLLMAELHSTLNSVESNESKIARLQQIYQDNLDPYTTAADTIKAIRNHEFANYRECLKRQLTDNGYPVEAVTKIALDNRREIASQEKEAKTEVKQQNANDIYYSSDRYIGQEQVKLNFDSSWETRCAVTKALLVSHLPNINRDPVWSPEFIKLVKYDKPNSIEQTELYYLLDNPDLAKQLSLLKYNSIFNRGKIAAPWKLRQNYLKVKALHDVGIYDFYQKAIADPNFTFQANSPEVVAIINKCRQRKNRDVLGMPQKDSIKFIKRLLESVGIDVRSRRVKQEGKVVSIYFLDREHLLSKERLAILKAIKLKYTKKFTLENQPLEWVVEAQNLAQNAQIKNCEPKIPETLARQTLESVADCYQNYINNGIICNSKTSHLSLVNLPTKMQNTNQLQSLLDSPESIADLAEMLTQIEDAEGLAELQQVPEFTRARLNKACRLLPWEWQQKLRQWVKENSQRGTA